MENETSGGRTAGSCVVEFEKPGIPEEAGGKTSISMADIPQIDFQKDIRSRAAKFVSVLNFKFRKCRGWRMDIVTFELNAEEPTVDIIAGFAKKKKRMKLEISFNVADIIMNRDGCVKEFMATAGENLK